MCGGKLAPVGQEFYLACPGESIYALGERPGGAGEAFPTHLDLPLAASSTNSRHNENLAPCDTVVTARFSGVFWGDREMLLNT